METIIAEKQAAYEGENMLVGIGYEEEKENSTADVSNLNTIEVVGLGTIHISSLYSTKDIHEFDHSDGKKVMIKIIFIIETNI